MRDMGPADPVVIAARALSERQREAIATWAEGTVASDRQLAMESVFERAREVGRYDEVIDAVDAAFRAAVESAGAAPYGYFAEDRGPAPALDAAARLAAQAAAAEVMGDLIDPAMHSFLVEPWTRLTG